MQSFTYPKSLSQLGFLLLAMLMSTGADAQKTDSIPFSNGHLYFHEYGSGEAIIMLTGGPGASYLQLEEVALHLGKTHRSILLEQRGTGRSMPQPYDTSTINIRTAVADLHLLLDHLKLDQAHFLGHSWGGMLAMIFATTYPSRVQSLMLVDSGPFKLDNALFEIYHANQEARLSPEDKEKRKVIQEKFRKGTATPEEVEANYRWELVPVLFDRTQVDSLMIKINKGGLHPKTGSFLFQSLAKQQFDVSEKLKKLTMPVHLIAGNQDPGAFVSYEIKLLLPAAQLHWINYAGHFPMYEQPVKFYAVLNGILKKE